MNNDLIVKLGEISMESKVYINKSSSNAPNNFYKSLNN